MSRFQILQEKVVTAIGGICILAILLTVSLNIYALTFFTPGFVKEEFSLLWGAVSSPDSGFIDFLGSILDLYYKYNPRGFLELVLIATVSTLVTVLLLKLKIKPHKMANNNKVTRGPRLLNAAELNVEFKKMMIQETTEIYKDLPVKEQVQFNKAKFLKGLKGKPFPCSHKGGLVEIPNYVQSRHQAFIGTTGVGKTTLIKHYLEHVNSLNEKSLILDLNGELYSEMGREGDIILSPYDLRSHKWDFSIEKSNGITINASEFARYIVPQGGDQNSFWWKGGRTVFTELLEAYPTATELWEAISDPKQKFRKKLSGVVLNIIGNEGSSQGSGILGTLSCDLGFLKKLQNMNEASDKEPFSIVNWAQDNSTANVYLVFSDKDLEVLSPIIRIWINLAVLGRFDAGPDNRLPKMNLIVDEIGSLGRLDQLPNALARLRKYGGKVSLGLQSDGQLTNIYGQDGAKAMKSNIGTRYIFRVPEEDESKKLANFLGRSEVISVSSNHSRSKTSTSNVSISESTSYKDIVLDSEIKLLPDGHFYLKSLNLSPAKLRIKKRKWPQIYPLHHKKRSNHESKKIGNQKINLETEVPLLETKSLTSASY